MYILTLQIFFSNYYSFFFLSQVHKKVTQRKYKLVERFYSSWLADNVTPRHEEDCRLWMMGKTLDSRNNSTLSSNIERYDQTPYRMFTRYSVKWVAPGSHSCSSPANTNQLLDTTNLRQINLINDFLNTCYWEINCSTSV